MTRDQWITLGIAVWGFGILFVWCLFASGATPQTEPRPKRAAPKRGAGSKAPRHKTPDCYGAWVRQYADDLWLVCNRCRARAVGSQVVEARAENERGLELLKATREGMALFQRERKGGGMIEHKTPECTGLWRLVSSAGKRKVLCDRCSAEHSPTPENRLAAIDENYAGIYLRRLTAEGAAQLKDGAA